MKNSNNVINVFKPRFRSNEVLTNIRKILESGWTGIGNKTDVFEKEWEKYTKLKARTLLLLVKILIVKFQKQQHFQFAIIVSM